MPDCAKCQDVGWVCEAHPDRPWSKTIEGGCQCGARMPCPDCNPAADAAHPPQRVVAKIEALSQKTVARGCTPGEARAALAKVIELKERYGVSPADIEYGHLFAALDQLGWNPYWPAPDGVPQAAWEVWCSRKRRQRAKELRKEIKREQLQQTEQILPQNMMREDGKDFQISMTMKLGSCTITMMTKQAVAMSEGKSFSEAWNNLKSVFGHVPLT